MLIIESSGISHADRIRAARDETVKKYANRAPGKFPNGGTVFGTRSSPRLTQLLYSITVGHRRAKRKARRSINANYSNSALLSS